ncbi:MAG: extracellular solute-binding protein, partial [Chloroflexi bacterium]|nr:extracellular solute-binding protein [Chloroflexota bacterium]
MNNAFFKKALTLASLLVLLLCGMGGAAAQDTVTLTWWTTSGRDSPEPAIRNVIAAFEAEHPNIKVDVSIMAEGAYNDLMSTAIAAGEGVPDLAWYWSNN